MSSWTLVWCLKKHNPDIDIDIDIDDTIEDDQGAWVLSSVYFPLADINTPQLFFKIYKIQSSCKYRWMQRYNFKFRQHIAGIHYSIHKTKDETLVLFDVSSTTKDSLFPLGDVGMHKVEMWRCTKWDVENWRCTRSKLCQLLTELTGCVPYCIGSVSSMHMYFSLAKDL